MVNLRLKSFSATLASLVLVTGFGSFVPAHAKLDCDFHPTAPICTGEPKPKPKPKPKLTAQQSTGAFGVQLLQQSWNG